MIIIIQVKTTIPDKNTITQSFQNNEYLQVSNLLSV